MTLPNLANACARGGSPDGRLFESVIKSVAPLKPLPTGSVICEPKPPP